MLLIDGVNITDTHGIWLTGEPRDWLSAPVARWTVEPLTGRVGGVVSKVYTVEPRRIVVPIQVVADTIGDVRTAEEWLKGQYTREVVVRFDDGTTPRQIRGVLEVVDLAPYTRALIPVSRGSITLLCGDPLWQEVSATDLEISGETEIPMGTAPVRHWSLAIEGALTDVTVVIKDGDGNTLHTLTWTGSMTTETLTIDSANGLVMLDSVNEFANYTGGFPPLDPLDEPTITVTADSGTPDATLSYKRRYW